MTPVMLGPAVRSLRGSWASLIALVVLGGACGGGAQPDGPRAPLKVVTWNLYLGADLVPLATVATPAEIPAVAAAMWATVRATDIPARAKLVAARIAELDPDLVALQEVTLYRRQTPSDYQPGDGPNAIDVELDFLALVMDELTALKAPYRVALEAPNADVELPVSDGAGGLFDLRVTDRDVILANGRVTTGPGVQHTFVNKLNITVGGVGGVPMAFTRSASHVPVLAPVELTFSNSHLEIGALTAVQAAQAHELVAFMAAIPGPMVLIGDFNSAPGASTYQLLMKSFQDPAAKLPPPATDPTCCQDGDLTNPISTAAPGGRIDLVLTRGPLRLNALMPIGTDPVADRTPSGRWASDHFGVVADLEAPASSPSPAEF